MRPKLILATASATPLKAASADVADAAHELLGDLLMEQKQPAEALVAYQHSVQLYPRRFNCLLGAAQAARALGDKNSARTFL